MSFSSDGAHKGGNGSCAPHGTQDTLAQRRKPHLAAAVRADEGINPVDVLNQARPSAASRLAEFLIDLFREAS